MNNVNEVNMAKWIVALRSGKYEQARGCLRDHDGAMCCMGVVCDVSGVGSWDNSRNLARGVAFVTGDYSETAILPLAVQAWLGINMANPWVSTDDSKACGDVNDCDEWTFGQIADALEARYLPSKKAEEILESVSA